MNKITLYLILFFTITGIQEIKASATTGATVNWIPTMNALQSTANSLVHFSSAAGQATPFMSNNQSSFDADGCITPIYYKIQAIMDLYHQNILTSNPTYKANGALIPMGGGAYTQLTYQFPMSAAIESLEISGGPLTAFYSSIIGVYNSSIIPDTLSKNPQIDLNAIKQSTFIAPSAYTHQSLQYLSTAILSLANPIAQLSTTVVNDIDADNEKISNDTTINPASNPLNSDILLCQVIQDLAFITSSILIYIANSILNTPNSATILYTPQISCSDTIATSIMAIINPPAGTSQATILRNVLNGSISATLPTDPTTITITQTTIYAAVCAFVLAYDANSTSGPFQPIINDLISANNAIQIL